MLSQIYSCGLMGIDGFPVCVQTDISNGMVTFEIVGLPDTTVKEAKERVRSAIKNTGLRFPAKRVIVNLAPANKRKEGSGYDLPITVSILNATEQLEIEDIDKTMFIGELSLDGSINSVPGVLPRVISAYEQGFKRVFVPEENANEAAVVEGIEVYPAKSLEEICRHFSGEGVINPHKINLDEYFAQRALSLLDFCDVKGQENIKRALEIAAAGGHNVLIIGDIIQLLTLSMYHNVL